MKGISLIVPISGRVNYLIELLESYICLTKPNVPYELIIVDNSTDPCESILIEKYTRMYQVRYSKSENGVVQARNKGAECASFDFLLFIDSDCTLEQHILVEYVRLIAHNNTSCAAGCTVFKGKESRWWKLLKQSYYLLPFKWCEFDKELLWAPTSNFLISKDVFLDVGCFQSILYPKEASEDVDLGIRVNGAGYKIVSCPQAIVYHTTETWNKLSAIIERFFRFGRGETELIIKHERYDLGLPSIGYTVLTLLGVSLFAFLINLHMLLISFPLFLFLSYVCYLIFRFFSKEARQTKLKYVLFLDFIELIYDSGKTYQALIKRKPSPCKFFSFTNKSYISQWNRNRILFQCYLLSLIVILVVLCLE